MKKIVFAIFFCLATLAAEAQVDKILGPWTAIDPDTDKPYATVLIYKSSNGLYYGKLTEILDSDDPADQKLIGTIIIKDMKEDDGMLRAAPFTIPKKTRPTTVRFLSLRTGVWRCGVRLTVGDF